jgi:hypothetical protein
MTAYKVWFVGDLVVDADSEQGAIEEALDRFSADPSILIPVAEEIKP